LQAKKAKHSSFLLPKATGGSKTVSAAPTRGEKWETSNAARTEQEQLRRALERDGLSVERVAEHITGCCSRQSSRTLLCHALSLKYSLSSQCAVRILKVCIPQ
jgi:hypothetical protein